MRIKFNFKKSIFENDKYNNNFKCIEKRKVQVI